jgi:hypothetical protein
MGRLFIVCEGQTEEQVVYSLLMPFFWSNGEIEVTPLLLPTRFGVAARRYKGGWNNYNRAKDFIRRHMAQHSAAHVWHTTMLDLYAIPEDFPGLDRARGASDPYEKVIRLEEAFYADLADDNLWRFVPNLQLHELEALLLVDVDCLEGVFPESAENVRRLREHIGSQNPELVDDGPDSAPSKRIGRWVPEYTAAKPTAAPLVLEAIGLERLLAECRHFKAWIELLGDCVRNDRLS